MEGLGAGAMLMLILFGIALIICWVLLPFALFGTKPLLREILAEMKEMNRRQAGAAPTAQDRRGSVARDIPPDFQAGKQVKIGALPPT